MTGRPLWWLTGAAWLALAVLPHHHPPIGLGGWALMSFAMTTPITLPAVRHVHRNSIRRRRFGAVALFLSAYNLVWLVFGIAVLGAATALKVHELAPRGIAVALLIVAAGWQLTRAKGRALRACRKTIRLPPQGYKANRACVLFGLTQARRCAVSCWPLMVFMAVLPVPLVVMAALAAFMYAEERTTLGREMVRNAAALLTVAAIGVAAFA